MKEDFPLELNDWSNATIDSLFVIDILVFESFIKNFDSVENISW